MNVVGDDHIGVPDLGWLMEESEGGPNRSGRLARRAKIIRRQTVAVVWCAGIVHYVECFRHGEEMWCLAKPAALVEVHVGPVIDRLGGGDLERQVVGEAIFRDDLPSFIDRALCSDAHRRHLRSRDLKYRRGGHREGETSEDVLLEQVAEDVGPFPRRLVVPPLQMGLYALQAVSGWRRVPPTTVMR